MLPGTPKAAALCVADGRRRAAAVTALPQHAGRNTVKLGNKERFDNEQIYIMEPFPVTNLPFQG